jgi:hypothetical protein
MEAYSFFISNSTSTIDIKHSCEKDCSALQEPVNYSRETINDGQLVAVSWRILSVRAVSTALLFVGLCVIAPSARASISFAGSGGQGTNGNVLTFCQTGVPPCGAGVFTVMASAWSNTGSGGDLATADLGQYNPFGLGVCNSSELAAAGGCQPPQHAIDNSGHLDFVLLTFSQPVQSITLTLSPFNTINDPMNATYIVGDCKPTPTSCSPNGKTVSMESAMTGFSTVSVTGLNSGNPAHDVTLTLNLTGTGTSGVNWVLIGANISETDDYFKLEGMTYSTTPEPATLGLAGIALLGIGLLRARKKRSASS